jgi:hypothetical protein
MITPKWYDEEGTNTRQYTWLCRNPWEDSDLAALSEAGDHSFPFPEIAAGD